MTASKALHMYSRPSSTLCSWLNRSFCQYFETSLHLAKGAAPDDGQRLEVGRAEPLPLQARVVPLSRLQLVHIFPPLGVRHAFPLQLALQLAAPVGVKAWRTVASAHVHTLVRHRHGNFGAKGLAP
jgi:hypothetical protein